MRLFGSSQLRVWTTSDTAHARPIAYISSFSNQTPRLEPIINSKDHVRMRFHPILPTLFLILDLSLSLLLPLPGLNDSQNGLQNAALGHARPSNHTLLSSIRCNGRARGYDLTMSSCGNAWRKMGRSSDQHGLFPRPAGFFPAIPPKWRVPIRYLSDDGLCAIDVDLATQSKGDTTSDGDIAGMAESILHRCVEVHGEGGYAEVPCKSLITIMKLGLESTCLECKALDFYSFSRNDHCSTDNYDTLYSKESTNLCSYPQIRASCRLQPGPSSISHLPVVRISIADITSRDQQRKLRKRRRGPGRFRQSLTQVLLRTYVILPSAVAI